MQSLHPEYDDLVARFIQSDSLTHFRESVDAHRLALKPEDAVNLLAESSQGRVNLNKRAAELYEVLLSERQARKEQEKALGKSTEEALWLDKEMRKYLEQSNWFEEQLKSSLEKSVALQEQLDEHSWHLERQTVQLEEQAAQLEKQAAQLERQSQQVEEQKLELDRRAELARDQSREIETLHDLLKQCRSEFTRTDEALGLAQQSAAGLSAELVEMKQSRSWRYTAWMRRTKGGL